VLDGVLFGFQVTVYLTFDMGSEEFKHPFGGVQLGRIRRLLDEGDADGFDEVSAVKPLTARYDPCYGNWQYLYTLGSALRARYGCQFWV
jgi:hypothetical protein